MVWLKQIFKTKKGTKTLRNITFRCPRARHYLPVKTCLLCIQLGPELALIVLVIPVSGDPVEALAVAGPVGPVVAGGGEAEAEQPAGRPGLRRLGRPVLRALVGYSPVS